MPAVSLKSMALSLHRWVGLILTPLFLLIVLSGGIMALKPVVEDPMIAGSPPAAEMQAVLSTLATVDSAGKASQFSVTADGRALTVTSQNGGPSGTFALGTGEAIPGTGTAFDFFGMVKSFHKNLLIGAGSVILYATYAMLAIVLIGPFLSWLRFRKTVIGWHLAAGWVALPLLVMTPLTGILMSMHIDTGAPLSLQPASPPVSFMQGIETVSQTPDVRSVTSARRFKSGSVMIAVVTDNGPATYVVDGSGAALALEGPGLVKSLHEGTWAGAWSGILNVVISIVLTLLTVTGFLSWFRRWRQSSRRSGAADADILVAYASQTGTAGQLAESTFRALESGGAKAACISLGGIRPDELKQYRHVLIIASTTGEGELAEPGRSFLKALNGMSGLNISFSVLALGDSRYRHFCAGGEALRSALLAAGAKEFLDMARADGAPQKTWHEWLAAVQDKLSISLGDVEGPEADKPVDLTLVERTRLDNSEAYDTSETWQVIFETAGEHSFRPGDLLMLSPGEGETERCYSIGNSALVEQDRIVLTVSRLIWTDEQGVRHVGKMSDLLCSGLALGSRLSGAIRRHPHFNPPEDPATPIIMVAAGCGVAPFPGFIEERARTEGRNGPTWLMFGNRHREGDFLYRNALVEWRKEGALTRLSTAFSRDNDDGGYITEEIIANGSDIVALLRDKGGVLYVCGRTRLGEGVEAALIQALVANDNVSEKEAQATLKKWKAAGSLRQDLFD